MGDLDSGSDDDSSSDEEQPQVSNQEDSTSKTRRRPARRKVYWVEKGAAEAGLSEELLNKDVYNRIKNNATSLMGQFEYDGAHVDEEESSDDSDVELREYSSQELRARKNKLRKKREKAAKKVDRGIDSFPLLTIVKR